MDYVELASAQLAKRRDQSSPNKAKRHSANAQADQCARLQITGLALAQEKAHSSKNQGIYRKEESIHSLSTRPERFGRFHKNLYCASNVAASESVGSPVGNSAASSCSDSWVIQLAYYGVEVPRHRRDADLGKCGWNGRCVGLQIDCENTFAQLDALANFPIDGLAPPSSVPDKTDCCGRCSNQALRVRLPCVLNRFLDGVVAKLQRGMAIVRLATERVDKSLVLRGETEENIGRHESATSSIVSLEGYLNYNAVIR